MKSKEGCARSFDFDAHRDAATSDAWEAEEAGGEVAAAEEVADGGEEVGAERAEGGAVGFFVTAEEGVLGGGEDLTPPMPNQASYFKPLLKTSS
jgi:hypothetical protein